MAAESPPSPHDTTLEPPASDRPWLRYGSMLCALAFLILFMQNVTSANLRNDYFFIPTLTVHSFPSAAPAAAAISDPNLGSTPEVPPPQLPPRTLPPQSRQFTRYVDPFIGTGGQGHTYPGATVPFGMVQLSPDNGYVGWEWSSGYHYKSKGIVGFSHTHLSGTGIGDGLDVSLLPTTTNVNLKIAAKIPTRYKVGFSHDDEVAEPGYYSVKLASGVLAEMTTTERTGLHRYTFPASLINTSWIYSLPPFPGLLLNLGSHSDAEDAVSATAIEVMAHTNTSVKGYRQSAEWAQDHRVYFVMEFSRPFSYVTLAGGEVDALNPRKMQGKGNAAAFFRFDSRKEAARMEPFVVLVKVGLSSVSHENAVANLRGENQAWNFDAVRAQANSAWDAELSKIKVESDDEDLKKVFYTALYHSKLAPTIFSDRNREYKGPTGHPLKTNASVYYSTLSIWDTFRAAHPLQTILNPDRVKDMLLTVLDHADEREGLLPIWPLAGSETETMPGYHAAVMLAEGVKKDLLSEEDTERAFEALTISAYNKDRGLHLMDKFGYVPSDHGFSHPASLSLEYGYDDWCTAQVAEAVGEKEVAKHFYDRSLAYQRIFDSKVGFMRAKSADGFFKKEFNAWESGHEEGDYVEGTAWQHLWFVPHDVPGLIKLLGGPAKFEAKLDELFTADPRIDGENASVDISGMIGQYAHGNEPSHHVAYLYNYAGAPHKTQSRVREILTTLYSSKPDGLAGNEDCGQMSAWYVFSALGFYPVNPAEAKYQLGSPLFDRAVVSVGRGKTFEVKALGAQSQGAMYVLSAKLNGKVLDRTYIEHSEIMAGGVLELEMSTGLTPIGADTEPDDETVSAASSPTSAELSTDEAEESPALKVGKKDSASVTEKKSKKKEKPKEEAARRK